MGGNPEREPPFFFMKSAQAILPNQSVLSYPPATADLQPEV
jgi:fumarylpyruvate hydrolase